MTTAQLLEQDQSGYIELIRKNADFRNLWFAELISAAGDWFNNVALLGLTLQLTGSGLATGLVLLSTFLPYFFVVPIAGPFVDRFSRKKVMIISNFVGAAAALTFLLVHTADMVWLIYVGMAIVSGAAAFFSPASNAIVPNLVSQRELQPANALSSATWGIMVMVGSALGGLVSAEFGRDVVFWVNSASFLVANLFLWRMKYVRKPVPSETVKTSTWSDFKEGLAYLGEHRPIMVLAACKAGWGLAGGVIVLLTIFGQQIFNAGDSGVGWLYAGRGLGAMAGPFLMRPFVGNNPGLIKRAIFISFLIQGVGYFIFGASPLVGLWVAVVALVIGHIGGGIVWVASSILLQETVPDEVRGRVFAIDLGLSTLANGLSTIVWSLALSWNAPPVALALVAAAVFVVFGSIWAYVSNRPDFQ